MAKKKTPEDYTKSLTDSFTRWDYLYTYGGQDPFYTDGVNLNLVRNHILYFKGLIADTMPPERYPDIYFRETPQEVDPDYMARTDDILVRAKVSLNLYKANPDYRFLCREVNSLSPKNANLISIRNVICYARDLERAITDGDLVTMRRHENPEHYLDSFASCAKRLRELPRENEQMSLFNYNENDYQDMEDEEMEW